MSLYSDIISKATGETDRKILRELESIMRQDIFHSTLDWQTEEQLKEAALQAQKIRTEVEALNQQSQALGYADANEALNDAYKVH